MLKDTIILKLKRNCCDIKQMNMREFFLMSEVKEKGKKLFLDPLMNFLCDLAKQKISKIH